MIDQKEHCEATAFSMRAVARLTRYRLMLIRFRELGFDKIFSKYLAKAVGVSSAQVRKDFSNFGVAGKRRGGYLLSEVLTRLEEILHSNRIHPVIMAGAGRLGSAIMSFKNFERTGTRVLACFDIDPAKHAPRGPIPVLPIAEMPAFVRDNHVRVGMICVPEVAAPEVLELMAGAGIRGVLNFAPAQLEPPPGCMIQNVNFELELESLICCVENRFGLDGVAVNSPVAPVDTASFSPRSRGGPYESGITA